MESTRVIILTAAVVLGVAVLLILHMRRRATIDVAEPLSIVTFLINLDRNPERLAHFRNSFARCDISKATSFVRVAAVDGSRLPIEQFVTPLALQEVMDAEANGYRTKHYQLTRGGVGCALSHIKAWKQLLQTQEEAAIVFEDDAVLHPSLLRAYRDALARIPPDWDILLLGYFCKKCTPAGGYSKVRRFFGLHGYAIHRRGVRKALDYGVMPINQQIDSLLSDAAEDGALNVYALPSKLVRQNNAAFRTEIQVPLRRQKDDPWSRAPGP